MAVQLLVSVNGGAPQSGGIDVPSAATIQLSAASTVGWKQQRWEIYEYPEGFATPVGWTLRADGVIECTDVAPPLITLLANTVLWGPWGFRLLIDEAVTDDATEVAGLVDEATAIHMASPNGMRMPMALEGVQFCTATTLHKKWVRTLQRMAIAIDASIGGDITDEVVTWSPTASPNGEAQSIHKTYDTSNATPATALTIEIPDESMIGLTATVAGRSADDQHFELDLRAAWSRTNGTVTERRAPATSNALGTNPGGWAAVFVLSGTNAIVRVTGEADLAIRWSVLASAQIVTLDAEPAAAATPLTIFGANLVGWLNETYDEDTGVWVDESTAAPANTTMTADVGYRPTESTINGHMAPLFDGVDDALNWGGARELLTGDFVVAAVIQAAAIAAPSQILGKMYGTAAWRLGPSFFGNAGQPAILANDDAASAYAESDSDISDDTPHVVVGVRSGTTVTLYVDGVLQADTGTHGSAPISTSTDFISLGAAMANSEATRAGFFAGKIGQPLMVDRAPTGPELTALHTYLMNWAGL